MAMKFLTFIFVLALMSMLSAVNSHAADASSAEVIPSHEDGNDEDIPPLENAEPTPLRGVSRFLAQRTRAALMKCNEYPRICKVKGSPGPDCCKKRCVNVDTDRFNCGRCGNKCKYSEMCCKGKCINPLNNKKHCGGCNKKCKRGSKCVYGMCSYA